MSLNYNGKASAFLQLSSAFFSLQPTVVNVILYTSVFKVIISNKVYNKLVIKQICEQCINSDA